MSRLAKMMSGIVSIVDAFSTQFLLVSDPSPTLSEIGKVPLGGWGYLSLNSFCIGISFVKLFNS